MAGVDLLAAELTIVTLRSAVSAVRGSPWLLTAIDAAAAAAGRPWPFTSGNAGQVLVVAGRLAR